MLLTSAWQRTSGQRAWRMMLSYGWIFFFMLVSLSRTSEPFCDCAYARLKVMVQILVLSWVEGRHFNSVGAYVK